ncbi:MAG: hypothetical protein E7316_04940 [Clostridiales bacterium]|nr:hypothetical protein [Clostridiales bacterium]
MPEGMTFLPDEKDIELSSGVGIVAAPLNGLQSLAAPRAGLKMEEDAWRGLLAFCLLADAWGVDGVTVKTIRPEQSAFASAVLREKISLVLWQREVLGVLNRQAGIVPAAQLRTVELPERVFWYDGTFHDPTDELNERDRTLLICRLSAMNQQGEAAVQRFISALTQAGLRSAQLVAHQDEKTMANLALRMKAILGQTPGVEEQRDPYAAAPVNPLLAALGLAERDEPPALSLTWRYNGTIIARSSSAIYCEGIDTSEAEAALENIAQDIRMLEQYSPTWRQNLARRTQDWLNRHQDDRALLPIVRTLAEEIRYQAGVPLPAEQLRLQWPWKAGGVVSTLWHEALGEELDAGMVNPFADELCLLPGGAWNALGDAVLSRLCVLPGDAMEPAAAVVPPLSRELAACVGDRLMMESFSFRRTEDGGVCASFALRGKDQAMLERVYAPGEIRRLSMEEAPTVAVWPCLPLPERSWRAYYVYIHGGTIRASALHQGRWLITEDRLFSVLKTESFPEMIALHADGRCLGVLPNSLPPCQPARTETALGLLDVGASGIALGLMQGEAAEPVQVPGLVRTLLRGGKAAPLSEEFLPAAPLGPVLPAAVELFNQKEEPIPLVDGHILTPETCTALAGREAKAMHSAWKWSVDAPARRARRMMLHQAMLTASLAAVLKGAPSISWRIALPEGMAAEGRRELWQEISDLAPVVAASCGLPLKDKSVSHGDESLALGTYLRSEGTVRGGFMALDVGSGDASMALWLRGMNRPAVRCNLPLGVQSMLLDGLMQHPGALESDFADMPDENARQSVLLLAGQLRAASGRKELEKGRFLLDQCLNEYGTALSAHMNNRFAQGRTTVTQSLVLQAFAALLALSGLVMEQVRRDPLLNDYLPAEMTFIMAGKGNQLMNAMPEYLKSALAQFVRLEMSGDHPVRGMRFLFSAAPKCDTIMGLARMTEVRTDPPAAPKNLRASAQLPMPPDLLMMRFLSAFRSVFPQASHMLYGHVFDQAGMITREGENLIRATAARYFAAAGEPEAALATCLTELRQIIADE